jgi:hypothetical protein
LVASSPAIEAGDDAEALDSEGDPLTTDQRILNRFFDGDGNGTATVDIGAVEATFEPQVLITGRSLFYNDSHYDGNDDAAGNNDDAAVSSKTPLLPGQTATQSNYSNYLKGINGIIVEIDNLPASVTPNAGDFEFKVGNENDTANWSTLSTQPAVSIRRGAGTGGSDLVTLTWAPDAHGDPVISNTWLQVKILESGSNNLGVADEFYFGNWIGEVSGPAGGLAIVNSLDFGSVSANFSPIFAPPNLSVDNPFDINKDNRVNSFDIGIVSSRFTPIFPGGQGLKMISPFSSGGSNLTSGFQSGNNDQSNPGLAADFSRFESGMHDEQQSRKPSQPGAATNHDAPDLNYSWNQFAFNRLIDSEATSKTVSKQSENGPERRKHVALDSVFSADFDSLLSL